MFNRLIGVSKPKPIAEEPKPFDMTPMTEHMSRLDQREKVIYDKIQKIDAQIADLKAKMQSSSGSTYQMYRQQAVNLLRQRKMYEGQLKSTTNMSMGMSMTMNTIENLQIFQEQYNVMKQVTDVQSAAFGQVDMNKFLDLNDRMQDMREDMDDLNEMIMDSMNLDIDMDEDELDRELASFQAAALPSSIPSQPASQIPGQAMGQSTFPSMSDIDSQLNNL